MQRIKQFLSDTDAYSFQKRVQRKFKRRHIISDSIDSIWDGDLQDARNISKYKYRLHRIFVQKDSCMLVDELANITQSINSTLTRPLGEMAPVDVTKETKGDAMFSALLERTKRDKHTNEKRGSLKGKKQRKRYYKFKVNYRARISHLKHTFQLEYDQKWTGEIFVITHIRFRRQGIEVYCLKDYADESISGTFYAKELQKDNKKEDTVWKVCKILKERTRKDEKQVSVSWYQWPSKYVN